MAIEQKLIIDKSKTSNYQIIVRDDTGPYSINNPEGYGGINGSPIESFIKYIFDINDLFTGIRYRQIQSDDINNPDEYYTPTVNQIANRKQVDLNHSNFNLSKFPDSMYKITMNIILNLVYNGTGIQGFDFISNASGTTSLKSYDTIAVGNEIYKITSITDGYVFLDRPIVQSFESYNIVLATSNIVILNDDLEDCLNKNISKFAGECNCDNSSKTNKLVELQILLWGLNRSIENEDYLQAQEYFILADNICKTLNCDC